MIDTCNTDDTIEHGVFVVVEKLGLLIVGEAGSGKSELALALISRGHQLIADDAPVFFRNHPAEVIGHCPELLQDFLEIRGLGLLNIRRLFGERSVARQHRLDLIIDLTPDGPTMGSDQRLDPVQSQRTICDVSFPVICPGPAPGRNLAILVETAVRDQLLRHSGYNPLEDFQARLQRQMKANK